MSRETRKRARIALVAVIASMLTDLDSESEDDELTKYVVMSEGYEEEEERGERMRRKVKKRKKDDELMDFYSETDFKQQFHINKNTFEHLCRLVAPYLLKSDISAVGRHPLDPKKQLLVTLFMLSSQKPFSLASETFGISKHTVWLILYRTVWAILNVNKDENIIRWPTIEEAKETTEGFRTTSRFPNVIGAIDGCHIPIKTPIVAPGSHVNVKGFHSVLLQAVCDHRMRFTDCYVGEVGSVDEEYVLRRSPLSTNLELATFFPGECHLLGNSLYILRTRLLTPYGDEVLSEQQKYFNCCHLKGRSLIEKVFAMLKGRFQRLRCLDMKRIDKVPEFVKACCVLHNVCIDNGDDFDVQLEVVVARSRPTMASVCNNDQLEKAIFKRDLIADELFANKILT